MAKKKITEKDFRKIAAEKFIDDTSQSAAMNIAELYKEISFNSGNADYEDVSVTGLDSTALTEAIEKQEQLLKQGDLTSLENMLLSQTHVLNAVFTKMVFSMSNAKYLDNLESFARIALRAQNQTRQTASTLAEIKGIKKTTFIHQLNNAHNQQINNNRAEENLKYPANEKVICDVDGRSKAERAGKNQQDEALVIPENPKGKEAFSHECNKAQNAVETNERTGEATSHAGEARKRSQKTG
jgi:hypothetical protein